MRLIIVLMFILAALLSGCADVGAAIRTRADADRARAQAIQDDAQARLIEAQTDAASVQALRETTQQLSQVYEARVRDAWSVVVAIALAAFVSLAVVMLAMRRPAPPQIVRYLPLDVQVPLLPPVEMIDAGEWAGRRTPHLSFQEQARRRALAERAMEVIR